MNPIRLKSRRIWLPASCAFLVLWGVGCSHESKVAVAPDPAPAPTQATQSAAATPTNQDSIEVSASLRQRCDLPSTPTEAPRFDFDDAALRPRGRSILDGLAHCMLEGNMKDQSVTVVGHTDPRGSEDYNFSLGARRAQAAASYLSSQGVSESHVWVKLRGEQDATGDSEKEWQLDRNVQIAEKDALPATD